MVSHQSNIGETVTSENHPTVFRARCRGATQLRASIEIEMKLVNVLLHAAPKRAGTFLQCFRAVASSLSARKTGCNLSSPAMSGGSIRLGKSKRVTNLKQRVEENS